MKILAWIKKYWWLVTIVPAILVALFAIVKFVVVYVTGNIGVPDLSDMEQEYWSKNEELKESERQVLEKIAKEKEVMWDKIDSGDPSPADIFNGEIQ